MPRRARLKIARHPLHVIQRGVNRCATFESPLDYTFYLGLLQEGARRCSCTVHAYVLMTNHVHLLLTPEEPDGASRFMKLVGERYVPRFNRRSARTGTLFEGRFRSSIVDSESYLLRCQRYIELNPVRARMVATARDYPWSSHLSNAEGLSSGIVVPHALYLALGASPEERRSAYRSWFGMRVPPHETEFIGKATHRGTPLGSARFIRDLGLDRRVGCDAHV